MSRNKNNLIKQTIELFFEKFSQAPEVISISPGRINIIGEHVDYNGGLAMPVATFIAKTRVRYRTGLHFYR